MILGGTVARANKPPIYGLQCPRGHRFDSGLLSFPDPLPTSSLTSSLLSKILHCPIQIKAKKTINKSLKKIYIFMCAHTSILVTLYDRHSTHQSLPDMSGMLIR